MSESVVFEDPVGGGPAITLPRFTLPKGIEDHEQRACHPRDLIERAIDFCRFDERPPEIRLDYLELAWKGYFGAID